MSDTPETDAAVISSNGQWSFVLKETCRRLERERDEARDQAQRLRVQLNHFWQANEMAEQAFRERDEAREDLEFRRGLYKVQEEYLEKARQERDEAREENAKLREIAESAIDYLDQSYRDGFCDEANDLRYELKQLKKETK